MVSQDHYSSNTKYITNLLEGNSTVGCHMWLTVNPTYLTLLISFYTAIWKMFVLCHGNVRPVVRLSVPLPVRPHFLHALRYQFETWYIHSAGGTTCRVWVSSQLGHFDLLYSQKWAKPIFFATMASQIKINPPNVVHRGRCILLDISSVFILILEFRRLFLHVLDFSGFSRLFLWVLKYRFETGYLHLVDGATDRT